MGQLFGGHALLDCRFALDLATSDEQRLGVGITSSSSGIPPSLRAQHLLNGVLRLERDEAKALAAVPGVRHGPERFKVPVFFLGLWFVVCGFWVVWSGLNVGV